MIKVLDKDLEKAIKNMSAKETVDFLRKTQDASGIKICQVITKEVK